MRCNPPVWHVMDDVMNSDAEHQPDVVPLIQLDRLRKGQAIIRREAEALNFVASHLSASFTNAVSLIETSTGAVIVTGVGKAGLIGRKIVATMASTGTRAFFLHPTEALHGDLGCVADDDVILAISNSGESEEVLKLLPPLRQRNIPVIGLTRNADNSLARECNVVLEIGRHQEAGDLGLAPSVSTTAMLAMGDALGLVLSHAQGFSQLDFARFHPAGSLGRNLCPVRKVMRRGTEVRIASETETVRQILSELKLPRRRTGAVMLTDDAGALSGIFTDSDLARLFENRQEQLIDGPVSEVMTPNPSTTTPDVLLPVAVRLMADRKISELPVIGNHGIPLGLLDITDVLDVAPDPVQPVIGVVGPASRHAESA